MNLFKKISKIAVISFASFALAAGQVEAEDILSELDGSFGTENIPGIKATPGRSIVTFDVASTAFRDEGIDAIGLANNKWLLISQVDIANVDANLVGLGLARLNDNGTLDTSFDNDGKRILDVGFTSVLDACLLDNGRVAVLGQSPGASGSGNQKDYSILVIDQNTGTPDPNFGFGGGAIYSAVAETAAEDFNDVPSGMHCDDNGILVYGGFDFPANNPTRGRGFVQQISPSSAAVLRSRVRDSGDGLFLLYRGVTPLGSTSYTFAFSLLSAADLTYGNAGIEELQINGNTFSPRAGGLSARFG